MDDIAAFLSARADELESAAKAAAPGPWKSAGLWVGASEGIFAQTHHFEDAAHIALNDPAHALAFATFIRAVVECYADEPDSDRLSGHDDYGHGYDDGRKSAVCAVALWLAGIWHDHPDFEPGWKP